MKELLSPEAAMQIIETNQVDFDDAWKALGYSSKQMAEKTLKSNFDEGLDYSFEGLKTAPVKGGRPTKGIVLTYDCFKMFGMMAGTAKGKEVRLYFINIEKAFRAAKNYLNAHGEVMKSELKKAREIINQSNQGVDPFKYIKLLENNIELLEEKAERLDSEINKPKKAFRKLTDEEKKNIAELWKTNKYTLNELARKVGRGASSVRTELYAAGLYKPQSK